MLFPTVYFNRSTRPESGPLYLYIPALNLVSTAVYTPYFEGVSGRDSVRFPR